MGGDAAPPRNRFGPPFRYGHRMVARGRSRKATTPPLKTGPSSDDTHEIVYFRRHPEDDPSQCAPGKEALDGFPTKVRATMRAVLVAVAAAPPKRFSGGGYWEAMHGEMTGWFEVRLDGPQRTHHRLFCLLDYGADDHEKPLLVVVDGRSKPFRTTLSASDYRDVRSLGDEYRSRRPRSVI
jgi:hypothetical protein